MARERKFSEEELFHGTEKILLQHGYEGFTISLLADWMDVSRGALYKYYENKDELIIDFMIFKMNQFIIGLKEIENKNGFESQFNYLMDKIFTKTEIHRIISIAHHMAELPNERLKENKEKLARIPLELYKYLHSFLALGKAEGKIREDLPESLMLGFIFQSIAIPNHFGVPQEEWIQGVKEIISSGMFKRNN